jgi:hypothetical protein
MEVAQEAKVTSVVTQDGSEFLRDSTFTISSFPFLRYIPAQYVCV